MRPGDVVRPVVSIAGLDASHTYRVAEILVSPWGYSLAFVRDTASDDAPALPIEHPLLFLEPVRANCSTSPRALLPV